MRTKTGNGHNVNVEQFLNDIKEVVHDAEQLLKAGVSGVKERAVASAKTTDRAVRKNPYQTIGIVFGVGIVLGLLFSGILSSQEEQEE